MTANDDIPINADDEPLVNLGSAAPVNVTLTTGETWRNSGVCRWVRRDVVLKTESAPDPDEPIPSPGGIVEVMRDFDVRKQFVACLPRLQQAWQNAATGAVEWRDVPTEAE